MQQLLRGFIHRAIFTAIGFLVSLLIAKLAGPTAFGALSLIIVNAAFIHIITGLGTDAAIVWHGIAEKGYDRNKVYTFTVISGCIQLVFFYIVAFGYFRIAGKTILGGLFPDEFFYYELIYFTGLVLLDKFSSLYYSQHLAIRANRITAIAAIIVFALILLSWWIDPIVLTFAPIQVFTIFTFIPAFVLTLSFYIKFRPKLISLAVSDLRSFAGFSILVLITNIIQFIAFRADYWILDIYYNLKELGIYAQASKFAQLTWIIPGILAGLITPLLKNKTEKFSTDDLINTARLNFYLHILIGILLIAISFLIYKLFLPVEYFNGYFSLLIMLPGYLIFTITTIMAAYFSANRLLKVNLIGSIICCCAMLLFDFILIPFWSYNGAALANLISYTITTIYFIHRACNFTNSRFSNFFRPRLTDFTKLPLKLFKGNPNI